MTVYSLTEINVFPIKSLGGVRLDKSRMTDRGLEFDRRWMLVDSSGQFLTQREHPKMALMQVSIHPDSLTVQDAGDSQNSLRVPFEIRTSSWKDVVVWKNRCPALVYGQEINDWFSRRLAIDCQLAYMPDESRRMVDDAYRRSSDLVSFADGFPTLIIGEPSLGDLNSRLKTPVGMDRFRSNLVFQGGIPFAEDHWKRVRIGDINFLVVKPCARCAISTVNPQTGVKGVEPLRTLASYRRDGNNGVMFGQNLLHENEGSLAVGQTLEFPEAE